MARLEETLPEKLLVLPQFVCWKYELRDGKPTKVPYNPQTGKRADVSDPATWATFENATRRYMRGGFDGLGFVFSDGGGIVGIDLDHCRDAETGALEAWAAQIVAQMGSYTEASPSGTGVHILLLGAHPKDRRRRTPYKSGAVEMYGEGRFFTLTGDHLAETPATLEARQTALDALYADLFPPRTQKTTRAHTTGQPLALDDQALLAKAQNRNSSAGREFAALWAGDWAGKKSASEADFALAKHLAWWTCHDRERVERLMRASGLVRDKWEKKCGASDYLAHTIENAILLLGSDMYSGAARDTMPCQVDSASEDVPAPTSSTSTGGNQDENAAPAAAVHAEHCSDELAAARARIAALEAEIAGLRAACERMNEKQRQIRDVIEAPGDQVAPAEKLVAIELLFDHVWREARNDRDAEGYAPVVLKTSLDENGNPRGSDGLADKIGISASTASKALDALEGMGAFPVKHDFPLMTSQGERNVRAIAAPAILRPKEWVRAGGPRTHGGARPNAGRKPKCSECGSEHVTERIMVQIVERKVVETRCKDCGAVNTARIGLDRVVSMRPENQDEKSATVAQHHEQHARVQDHIAAHLETTPRAQRENSDENAAPGMNHHDERAALLAIAQTLDWPRIPIAPGTIAGGSVQRWQTFTHGASNEHIDAALRQLRIRAEALSSSSAVEGVSAYATHAAG